MTSPVCEHGHFQSHSIRLSMSMVSLPLMAIDTVKGGMGNWSSLCDFYIGNSTSSCWSLVLSEDALPVVMNFFVSNLENETVLGI